MKRLPADIMRQDVAVLLKSGARLDGICILSGKDYLMIAGDNWHWTIEAEDIAAIGVRAI